jgi:glutaconyl-CoA/methylmalonyl-CoA decarboxylase subunit delta
MTDTLFYNNTDSVFVQVNEHVDEVCIFAENDPYGLLMSLLGMAIVFFALVLLFVVFNNTPMFFRQSFRDKLKNILSFKKKKQEEEKALVVEEKAAKVVEEISGEINAAIATAIFLYRSELHDYEDAVLTIKKVSRTYSPWSSKIYGLRNNLNNLKR